MTVYGAWVDDEPTALRLTTDRGGQLDLTSDEVVELRRLLDRPTLSELHPRWRQVMSDPYRPPTE